jgi:hypothetical protein
MLLKFKRCMANGSREVKEIKRFTLSALHSDAHSASASDGA